MNRLRSSVLLLATGAGAAGAVLLLTGFGQAPSQVLVVNDTHRLVPVNVVKATTTPVRGTVTAVPAVPAKPWANVQSTNTSGTGPTIHVGNSPFTLTSLTIDNGDATAACVHLLALEQTTGSFNEVLSYRVPAQQSVSVDLGQGMSLGRAGERWTLSWAADRQCTVHIIFSNTVPNVTVSAAGYDS